MREQEKQQERYSDLLTSASASLQMGELRNTLNSEWAEVRSMVGYCAVIVAISIGGSFNDGVLLLGLLFGGIFFIWGVFHAIKDRVERKAVNEDYRKEMLNWFAE